MVNIHGKNMQVFGKNPVIPVNTVNSPELASIYYEH